MGTRSALWFATLVLVFGRVTEAVAAPPPLPEGDAGIAANYPGDAGIGGDPAVVFADDFESYTVPDDLWSTYDNVYQLDQIRFADQPENVYSCSQPLEFTVPQQDAEPSNPVGGVVSPERHVVYP